MASIVENEQVAAGLRGESELDLVDLVSTLAADEKAPPHAAADEPLVTQSSNEADRKPSPPPPTSSDALIDTKQRKKLDKLIDNILKKPKNSEPVSLEEKYYALAQKFIDTQEQNKKLQLNGKEVERTMLNLSKQRDQIQTEYGKTLLVKAKLESLCRELQKQNKLVKEESLQRIEDEEKKRKEISAKFQTAIDEINQQVAANSEKNNTLITENVQLSTKLKNLIEQYEVREQHIEKVLKHKDLEVQLANAKLHQSELIAAEMTERGKKEKAIYEAHCAEINKKCEFHQDAEKQLKAQLTLYTQKYEEFQSTLTKSNQVFESFRTEMDKMTKKIKKLEQETTQWKGKWEGCDQSLQKVLKQKEELEEKGKKVQARADMMEKISRSLQDERNTLKQQTKLLEEKLKSFTISEEVKEEAPAGDESPAAQVTTTTEVQSISSNAEPPAVEAKPEPVESHVEEKPAEQAQTSN